MPPSHHSLVLQPRACDVAPAVGGARVGLSLRPLRLSAVELSSTKQVTVLFSRAGVPLACRGRVSAWFKFGKRGIDAESSGIYGSQGRDDFDRNDVEHYFNYMGMLAVEGTYDKLEALLNTGIHPVDILLMMAASEGDRPKIQELLKAGAVCDVKNADGKTALDLASENDIRELILEGAQRSTV